LRVVLGESCAGARKGQGAEGDDVVDCFHVQVLQSGVGLYCLAM
jgi:hypothetical protein